MDESLRILILEDNPADAELVQFELQEAGIVFTPKVVMTEEDFVRAIGEFSPDLILSDYDLPKYNGGLALAEARRRCPDTPFILVTGAVTEDRAIDILTQGAKDYVLKNRLNQRLAPAVRRALAEAEEHRARKQAEGDLRKTYGALESLVGKRTTELQAVLDTAPVAIWIAHDPECKIITGNAYADEIIMKTSRLGNISRSAAPGEVAVFYKVFHDGVELKPEEMPAQVATATGKSVTDMELELVFSDGRQVHLIESAVPLFDPDGRVRGAVITGSDVSQIKQSESAFKKIEKRQRLVLQASSIGTFEVDLLTGEGQWNETEFELLGLKPGDVKASPDAFFRYVHPDDVGQLQSDWEEATRTGKLDSEFRIVRADGRECWLAGKGSFIFDGHPDGDDTGTSGKPWRFMGVNFDITERRKAGEALRESEARLRGTLRSIADEIWIIDTHGCIVSLSDSVRENLGVGSDKWADIESALDQLEILRPDGTPRPREDAPLSRALRGEVIRNEGEMIRNLATGQLRRRELSGTPVRDEGGRIIGAVVVVRDITERKQAEAEIARLASFPMLNPDPILEVDFSGAIHFCNPAAERLFPDCRQRGLEHPLLADWEAVVRSFCEGELKGSIRELNINSRWYLQTKSFVEETKRIRVYVHDITLRKEAERKLMEHAAQLEEVNKDLESFSYSVSHDLRAPLRAIKGFSHMILKKEGERFNDETKGRFQTIQNSAKKMDQLIEDMLTFSRLGSKGIVKESLDMGELIKTVWQELLASNTDRQMTLTVGQMPVVSGDRALIRQVYSNLLGNAVKFTQGRDVAGIEAGSCIQNGEKAYYVRDNGVGFDMIFYDKLFGVFKRLHSDEEYKGTGIGLALVKRIINRHEGRVWAEGEVGKGATFYFTLPIQ
jgi:PAS domain S-box-containing protein